MNSYLVFVVNNKIFALDINRVIKVLNIPNITILPNSEEYIDGIFSDDEQTVKVVNFQKLIKVSNDAPKSKLIIYSKENYCFALKVDDIKNVINISTEEIFKSSSSNLNEVLQIAGIYEDEKKLIYVVNDIDLQLNKEEQL